MKKKISISIDGDLLEEMDRKRGMIPRSAYMGDILKRMIKNE